MSHRFVDVWLADLNLENRCLSKLIDVMSPLEKQRAETFQQPLLRNRYQAVRAITRHVLASYLPMQPANIEFVSGEHGKPNLLNTALSFNISHTGHWLLIAVANLPDIGIDIEQIKTRSNVEAMARRCLADSELLYWRSLSDQQSLEVFYRLWTKKEAFVKAVGRGIAMGLNRCEVEPHLDGQLIAIPEEYGVASAWKVTEIAVTAGISSALVTPNCRFELNYKTFEADALIFEEQASA